MERHKQFAPVLAQRLTNMAFSEPNHSHNYYEMIFIDKGRGTHVLNGESVEYKSGTMFLINPSDIHHFVAQKPTTFMVIRFTEAFFQHGIGNQTNSIRELKLLMTHPTIRRSGYHFQKGDTRLLRNIYRTILSSSKDQNIIFFQVMSLLQVLKKHSSSRQEFTVQTGTPAEGKMEKMLEYIHQHITKPQVLRIEELASQFFLSKHYVSAYFKRHMGLSLTQYIDRYRLALIEHRLKHSHFTVKEIAYDFGFTDESHLNKFIKKYRGKSARAYRVAYQSALESRNHIQESSSI